MMSSESTRAGTHGLGRSYNVPNVAVRRQKAGNRENNMAGDC